MNYDSAVKKKCVIDAAAKLINITTLNQPTLSEVINLI